MAAGNGSVKEVATDRDFQNELVLAGSKLVVVDFHATWLVRIN